jgi:hypothetical protein
MIYTTDRIKNNALLKLYIPDDNITVELKKKIELFECIFKKEKAEIPLSFTNNLILLEIKKEDFKEPLIISRKKLLNGEYQNDKSNSDKKVYDNITKFIKKLPSFKKYINEDNINFIIKQHRLFLNEIMEYRQNGAISTFKTDINNLLRILYIGYNSKDTTLYYKYTIIMQSIKDKLEEKDDHNDLPTEKDKVKFLEWRKIMREHRILEENFQNNKDKKKSIAYNDNQKYVLLSLYTLTPPLRDEISQLEFTFKKPTKNGDYVYFHNDGNVSLELNNIKKKHDYITVPLTYRIEHNPSELSLGILENQKKLAKILRESYDLYNRKFVFTNLNKYPELNEGIKSVSKRLTMIFEFYGKKIAINSLRKSYVSNLFQSRQLTMTEKKELAKKFMRTSDKYLNTTYYKIFNEKDKNIKDKEDNEEVKDIDSEDDNEPKGYKNILDKGKDYNKKMYDKLKEIKVIYEGADGRLIEGTEASKRKLEAYRKKWGVKMDENAKYEYGRKRYITAYNKAIENNDLNYRERIRENTLNKYGLTKYNEDGSLKIELR